MKLLIEMELDNENFVTGGVLQVSQILDKLTEQLPEPLDETKGKIGLRDWNGNHVGTAEIVSDRTIAARAFAALGGKTTSARKRAAVQANGRKGGRPVGVVETKPRRRKPKQ